MTQMAGITRAVIDPRPDGGTRARARARAMAWQPSPEAVADLRRLAAESLAALTLLSSPPELSEDEKTAATVASTLGDLDGAVVSLDAHRVTYHSPAHQWAASAVLAPWLALCPTTELLAYANAQAGSVRVVRTQQDAGLTNIAIGALVVVGLGLVAGGTVSTCWALDRASELVDRELSRRADVRKMVASQEAAVRVIERHAEREAQAGKPLDYDPQEQAVIRESLDNAAGIAAKKDDPYRPPTSELDLPSVSLGAGLGIGALIVIGIGALLIMKG